MIRLKDAEGGALLVNPQFVVLVNSVKAKSDLGAPQLVIGKCALVMSTGITLVVNHTVEEVYGLMRRPEQRDFMKAVPDAKITPISG